MQTDSFGPDQKYVSMRDCFKQVWRAEGALGFWKGIGPTLIRAMPVSAGQYTTISFLSGLVISSLHTICTTSFITVIVRL